MRAGFTLPRPKCPNPECDGTLTDSLVCVNGCDQFYYLRLEAERTRELAKERNEQWANERR